MERAHKEGAYGAMPIQVWTARPDGSLDYVNQAVVDYFSVSAERLLEDGWRDVCHPLDLTEAWERWTHALESGETYEVAFRLLSGHDRHYRWHVARAAPVRDAAGVITGWVGTNAEIDGFKRAEELGRATMERTQRERDRWHQLFALLPTGIIVTAGADMTIEMCNPQAGRLSSVDKVGGLPFATAFAELADVLARHDLVRLAKEGRPAELGGVLIGGMRCSVQVVALQDAAGETDGMAVFIAGQPPGE